MKRLNPFTASCIVAASAGIPKARALIINKASAVLRKPKAHRHMSAVNTKTCNKVKPSTFKSSGLLQPIRAKGANM
jgi:hypothetical protein